MKNTEELIEVNGEYEWQKRPTCPLCYQTTHTAHCGRCDKPLVRHPDGETESCPTCTTRIGRW